MSRKPLLAASVVFAAILAAVAAYFIFIRPEASIPAFGGNTVNTVSPSPSPSPSLTPAPTATPTPAPDLQLLLVSEENYEEGCKLLELKLYSRARVYFERVSPDDAAHYSSVKGKLAECMTGIKAQYAAEAQEAYDKTHYLEAESILNEALKEFPGDSDLEALSSKAAEAWNKPELYTGPIYHVFFHSLIIYPELCFTGDGMTRGYNEWMTTVYEFKRMLPEMYDRGYILVNLADLFSLDASGKAVRNDLYLPKGKIPLVISVDDVAYYEYMRTDGFAERLVLDGNGDVATQVKTPEGEEIVTRDGDVMPILDDFVKYHPDFSWNNAKGVLALTGYEGILGYNTRKANPDWERQKADVQRVVDRLKATGWEFACHSYTHRHTYTERTVTLDYIKYDMGKWKDEVASIVGPTSLYIAPYGVNFGDSDPRLQYIISQGFIVYCGIGVRPYYELDGNYVFQERIDLDGYKMNRYKKELSVLFDVDKVYDPARPPFNYY